jgi:alpha-1,6-mannosyltransferase
MRGLPVVRSAGDDTARGTGGRDGAAPLRGPPLIGAALTGFVASSAIVIGAMVGGATFMSHLPGAWFFGTPKGPLGSLAPSGNHPRLVGVLAVYGGLALLSATWVRVLRTLGRHRGVPVRRVLGVIALWALPLVLAPPLFSQDVYSYAGQGEMVSHHIDPYSYGTGVIGATRFTTLAGPLWANTPSPYGPTFLALDGAVTDLAGHDVLVDLALLRLIELVGLMLVVAGLPTLAREAGRDPAEVVLLGVGSPVVLTTLVAGAHNDALMLGLLVAGLALARRIGPVPGIVVCALAAGVKAPAALGVLFIGWNWAGPAAGARARVGRTLGTGAIAGVTLALVSEISGIGWGWVRTVGAPAKISTGVTPVDALAHAVIAVTHLLGLGARLGPVRGVLDVIGLLGAACVGIVLLLRSPRIGMLRALGLTLLVLAILGPVLWSWYLCWGLVVLGTVATGMLRRTVVVLSIAGALVGAAPVLGTLKFAFHAGALDDILLVLGIGAAALFPAHPSRRRRLSSPPSPRVPESGLVPESS